VSRPRELPPQPLAKRSRNLWLLKLLEIPQIRHFGQCWEINALFDIIDLPTDLFGFAAYSFNCGGLK